MAWWHPWLALALIAAIAGLAGFLFGRLVLDFLRKLAQRTRNELDDLVLRAIHPAIGILVAILTFQALLQAFSHSLPPRVLGAWQQILLALAILVGAVIAARLATGLLRYGTQRHPNFQPVARLGSRVLNVAVYLLAFLVVIGSYGISITPLVTSLGIAGLAVALALQDTLSNFFAGVWIQTGRAMQPGNHIRLEEHKLDGMVVEVGWRTTKIKQFSNTMVVVPNAKLAQAIVIDYSLPDPSMGSSLVFSVPGDTDVKAVLALLEEAARAQPRIEGMLRDPPPSASLRDVVDGNLLVGIGFHVRSFPDQGPVQGELRLRVVERLREAGIHVAGPAREVRVRDEPPGGRKGAHAGSR